MSIIEHGKNRQTFFSTNPLSGVISSRGPDNPFRVYGNGHIRISENRATASGFGRLIERYTLEYLRGEIKASNPHLLSQSAAKVRGQIRTNIERVITEKYEESNSFELSKPEEIRSRSEVSRTVRRSHQLLAEAYQKLTDPPEVPFLENARLTPTNQDLTSLFQEVDKTFNSNFCEQFSSIPSDYLNRIDHTIFHLVEVALSLSSLVTDVEIPSYGKVIPDIWLRDNKGKPITQFDGIIIPRSEPDGQTSKAFDLRKFLAQGTPYSLIQVKYLSRARHVSSAQILPFGPFTRDIRELQTQLAKMILDGNGGHIHLPQNVHYYYLRGLHSPVMKIVHLDHGFLTLWRDILQDNIAEGHITEDFIPDAVDLTTKLGKFADNTKGVKFSTLSYSDNNFTQLHIKGLPNGNIEKSPQVKEKVKPKVTRKAKSERATQELLPEVC